LARRTGHAHNPRVDNAKHELVARLGAHPVKAPALECGERAVCYGELERLVAQRAGELRAHGAEGSFIALQRRKSVAYLVDLLAILAVGGTAVPLDADLPARRRDTFVTLARPALLVHEDGISALRHRPWTGVPADGAFVFFTSGSTGTPKPVLSSAASVKGFAAWFGGEFGLGPGDRFAFLSGVSFEASLRDIFPPLYCGATIVMPEDEQNATAPEQAVDWLAHKRITVVTVVPSLARAWLRHRTRDCATVRAAFFVGEPVPADVLAEWRQGFPATEIRVNSYGSTESGQATVFRRVAADEQLSGMFPAGRPVPGTRYCFIEPGSPLTTGVVQEALRRERLEGEIVIVSRACSHGYLGLPGENEARFTDLGDGLKAYRTGDLGRRNDDGDLVVLGRADDEVKINGVRVHPAEVTRALRDHPAVADAFVTAGTNRLTAFWVRHSASTADVTALRAGLLDTLPPAFIPSRFVELDRLPRTRTGKVDRAALTAEAAQEQAFVPPEGEVEAWLAGQLAEVLETPQVSATADLFALGADSLAVARLAARILDEYGVELSQRDIFAASTVRATAGIVVQRQLEQADPQALAALLEAFPA
jgi:amino acid adenylation domain-containing protein